MDQHTPSGKQSSDDVSPSNISTLPSVCYNVTVPVNVVSTHPGVVRQFSEPVRQQELRTTVGRMQVRRVRMAGLHVPDMGNIMVDRLRSRTGPITISSVFRRIWSIDIVKTIVGLTNERLSNVKMRVSRGEDVPKASRYIGVRDVTVNEVYRFMGVLLLMGALPLPTEKQYWEGTIFGTNEVCVIMCGIRRAMSYSRYRQLRLCLCFSSMDESDSACSYGRLNWMADTVFQNCRELYTVGDQLVFDDQSIRYTGQFVGKQGSRCRKEDKYAVVFNALGETSGFTLGLYMQTKGLLARTSEPSHGAGAGSGAADDSSVPLGATNQEILNFVRDMLPKPRGRYLYFDSEFTNYTLFHELSKMGILAIGTARHNWLTWSSPELRIAKKQRRQLAVGM